MADADLYALLLPYKNVRVNTELGIIQMLTTKYNPRIKDYELLWTALKMANLRRNRTIESIIVGAEIIVMYTNATPTVHNITSPKQPGNLSIYNYRITKNELYAVFSIKPPGEYVNLKNAVYVIHKKYHLIYCDREFNIIFVGHKRDRESLPIERVHIMREFTIINRLGFILRCEWLIENDAVIIDGSKYYLINKDFTIFKGFKYYLNEIYWLYNGRKNISLTTLKQYLINRDPITQLYRGYKIPNHHLYNSIYKLDHCWIGLICFGAISKYEELAPINALPALHTKPAPVDQFDGSA